MSAVECGRGHLYDPNIYTTCPYCNNKSQAVTFGGVSVGNDNRTVPIAGNYNVGSNSYDRISPLIDTPNPGVSLLNDGKTMPPKDFSKPKKVEDDNKTVGLMKEKLGMDPVVGWLVCIEGKQIGKDYKIRGQINTIGRSDKMDICIKEDMSISYENHARLSYSERNNNFNLIPAESKNVMYLNDNEIFTPTKINAYDIIDFGETKLIFVPLCNDIFNWKSKKTGDISDVSIQKEI